MYSNSPDRFTTEHTSKGLLHSKGNLILIFALVSLGFDYLNPKTIVRPRHYINIHYVQLSFQLSKYEDTPNALQSNHRGEGGRRNQEQRTITYDPSQITKSTRIDSARLPTRTQTIDSHVGPKEKGRERELGSYCFYWHLCVSHFQG